MVTVIHQANPCCWRRSRPTCFCWACAAAALMFCHPLPRRQYSLWTMTGKSRGCFGSQWTLTASGGPRWTTRPQELWSKVSLAQWRSDVGVRIPRCLTPTGIRADSVAVDWLGRNLYWIDGVNSQIVAIGLDRNTEESLNHSVILDEDLDQPRSLALLPQKGSVSHFPLKQTQFSSLKSVSSRSY